MITTIERKIGVLVALLALAGAFGWIATVSAQSLDKSVPWIIYAAEIGGAATVVQLDESGFTATDDLWQFANSCAPAHVMSGGKGQWRFDPGTNRRAMQVRTLHAVVDPNVRALGLNFEQITMTFKFARRTDRSRFVGGAQIHYYDTIEHVAAGQPACTSHSMDIRGYATFPSS